MNVTVIITTVVCGIVGFIVGVVSGKRQYLKIQEKTKKGVPNEHCDGNSRNTSFGTDGNGNNDGQRN